MSDDASARLPAQTSRSKATLVIADDSPDTRLMLRVALGRKDDLQIVAEAVDGVEATEMIALHRPSVALIDLAMPRMDGLEAIGAIRRRSPETRIVVLSGFDEAQMRDVVLAHGAHDYVAKGCALSDLAERIRAQCSRGSAEGEALTK